MTGVKSTLAVSVSAVVVIASAGTDVGASFSDAVSQGTPAGVTTLVIVVVSLVVDAVGVIAVGATLSARCMVGETISLVLVGIIVACARSLVSIGTALVESGEITDSASRLTISFGNVSDNASLTSSSAL